MASKDFSGLAGDQRTSSIVEFHKQLTKFGTDITLEPGIRQAQQNLSWALSLEVLAKVHDVTISAGLFRFPTRKETKTISIIFSASSEEAQGNLEAFLFVIRFE